MKCVHILGTPVAFRLSSCSGDAQGAEVMHVDFDIGYT